MNNEIQSSYEKIVALCSTQDLCYAKCMKEYRKYIEENFAVQTMLEFPDFEYNISSPVSSQDLSHFNTHA